MTVENDLTPPFGSRITDYWDPSKVDRPDPHDRGIMNRWESILVMLRTKTSPEAKEAAELIEAMADRLKLPKEPLRRSGKALLLYQPLPWKDEVERLEFELAYTRDDNQYLRRECERLQPWYVKLRNYAVVIAMIIARIIRGDKGPMG